MAVTSNPTPVKLPAITSGTSVRNRREITPAKTVYTATKVEKVTSTDGKVQYQTTVIQYDNANKENPKAIATGYTYTDANGKSKTVLEPAAGLDEQTRRAVTTRNGTRNKNLRGGGTKKVETSMNGAIANASQQQVKQSKEIQDLAKNSSEQETLDAVSGPEKETETNTNENTNSLEAGELTTATKAKVREQYDLNLKYPIDLQPSLQDTLKISVYKFVPRKLDGLTIAGREKFADESDSKSKKGRIPIGGVVLPVVGPKDSNKVGWGGKPMSAIDIAMSDLALSGISGGVEGFVGAAKKIGSDVQSDSGDVKTGLTAFFAQQATGVQGLLSRTEGIIVNPNLELLFNGPTLRNFGFSYKMSPRNEPESKMIRKIIRMFKQSMAAQRSTSNLFLKTPNTYRLQFITGGTTEHTFLPKIKECALTSFDVNYAADGTYATFGNTSPVAYELRFSFQELIPIFNDDYTILDKDEDTNIGF